MKILFICGSAEPGNDGVGDYTRRMCGEFIRSGHQTQIVSLCDLYLNSCFNEKQLIEDTEVLVHRIPLSTTNLQRFIWTQNIINIFKPDWISLQFVPYSFHSKGLPFWLPKFLKKLKGSHQWQIMFHELWIGIEREATFKNKCVGFLQKRIICRLKKSINPNVVHTQAKIYQYYLSKIAIKSNYLPLFGNIAVTASKKNNSELITFVVFATIHNKAPFEKFIIDLKKEMENANKSLKFVFIGRNGDLLDSWISILDHYRIEYELLGPSSEETISQVLIDGSYGISTTPYKISDKSGVVAAMRNHQLPIISIAKPWIDIDDITIKFDDIIQYKKEDLIFNLPSKMENNSLISVCNLFLNSIHL